MRVQVLRAKVHGAVVTHARLDYEGSLSLDSNLLRASGMLEYEKVQVVNLNNGARFETYVIAAPKGSGTVGLNGAAARKGMVNDKLIIMSYATLSPKKAPKHKPIRVFVDDKNQPTKTKDS